MAESFSLLSAMERFIRHEHDSCVMRMRLIYNGELTSDTGVPLSQIAIAKDYQTLRRLASLRWLKPSGGLGIILFSIVLV